jgi:hypothetical protein
VEVIGAALLARVRGWGYRRIAAWVGRPISTVRAWVGRVVGNAQRIFATFMELVHELETDPAPVAAPAPTGSAAPAATTSAPSRAGRADPTGCARSAVVAGGLPQLNRRKLGCWGGERLLF